MAIKLIPCIVCKTPMSENAVKCQMCGEPEPTKNKALKKNAKKFGFSVFLVAGTIYIVFFAFPEINNFLKFWRSQ